MHFASLRFQKHKCYLCRCTGLIGQTDFLCLWILTSLWWLQCTCRHTYAEKSGMLICMLKGNIHHQFPRGQLGSLFNPNIPNMVNPHHCWVNKISSFTVYSSYIRSASCIFYFFVARTNPLSGWNLSVILCTSAKFSSCLLWGLLGPLPFVLWITYRRMQTYLMFGMLTFHFLPLCRILSIFKISSQ